MRLAFLSSQVKPWAGKVNGIVEKHIETTERLVLKRNNMTCSMNLSLLIRKFFRTVSFVSSPSPPHTLTHDRSHEPVKGFSGLSRTVTHITKECCVAHHGIAVNWLENRANFWDGAKFTSAEWNPLRILANKKCVGTFNYRIIQAFDLPAVYLVSHLPQTCHECPPSLQKGWTICREFFFSYFE